MNDIIEQAQEQIRQQYGVDVKLIPQYSLSCQGIATAVCKYYQLEEAALQGKERYHYPHQRARKAFCWIAKRYGFSNWAIAQQLKRHASSIQESINVAAAWQGLYSWFVKDVEQIVEIMWRYDSE